MKKLSCSGRIHPFFLLILLIIVAIPMGFYGMYLYISPTLPDMKLLKTGSLEQPLQVYSKDGLLIAEFGDKLSFPVKYDQIPVNQIHAFLAAEDSAFFEHSGVSFKGLGRALTESVSGGAQTGGSTITMQVAKNYYLSPERTLKRKLTEIFLARKIEQTLTKQEILTLYVNKIFLGKNAYGIGAAARVYYNKNLNQMTLAEQAMIAGLPKAPSKYNPVANPTRALERRNWILARMLQLGYITQAQYDQAVHEPIKLDMQARQVEEKFPYVSEVVRAELIKRFGDGVINSGYKVYTTVDSHRQIAAEQAVRDGLEAYDKRHGWRGGIEAQGKPLSDFLPFANTWPAQVTKANSANFEATFADGTTTKIYQGNHTQVGDIVRLRPTDDTHKVWTWVQIPNVEGQLIALNPNNGAVEAMVGGYDYRQSKFNRSVQGWRQPGSTIKPFIYTLALERGFTPFSIVRDSPLSVGKWHPKNSDNKYLGPIPLRKALYLSRNMVSIRLLQAVGLQRARNYLMNFGLIEDRIPNNLTIALGTAQVLPIEMATGYAAFANGGYRIQPFIIDKIVSQTGELLFQADPVYACAACQTAQDKAPVQTAAPAKDKDGKVIDVTNGKDPKQLTQQVENKPADPNNPTITDATHAPVPLAPANGAQPKAYHQAERVIKAGAAYDMAGILHDVIVHGTGRAALKLGRDDLGGKTGTTNDAKDAWFAGFNGNLVAVSWVGFDSPRTLGKKEFGGVAALPIWTDFMAAALKDTPSQWVRRTTDDDASKDSANGKDQPVDDKQKKRNAKPPMAYALYKPQPKADEGDDSNDFSGAADGGDDADDEDNSDNTAPVRHIRHRAAKPATEAAPAKPAASTSPNEIF